MTNWLDKKKEEFKVLYSAWRDPSEGLGEMEFNIYLDFIQTTLREYSEEIRLDREVIKEVVWSDNTTELPMNVQISSGYRNYNEAVSDQEAKIKELLGEEAKIKELLGEEV